ncbi:MAG: hypothetical protein ACE5ED_08210, partial [Rhodothalassiaceae bacterium]
MSRLLLAFLIQLAGATTAGAAAWQVVPDASRILWTAKWNTAPVQGGFEHFTASIDFDPRNLAQSRV